MQQKKYQEDNMSYTVEYCSTKEEIAALINKNAKLGSVLAGSAVYLNGRWAVAFTIERKAIGVQSKMCRA